ncbi:hypothetical protein HYV84_03965 [Candidatus Woesearchaeota archaeon]|nr:hypothetical protein [Candidatus Woesearchaeota archaeon]
MGGFFNSIKHLSGILLLISLVVFLLFSSVFVFAKGGGGGSGGSGSSAGGSGPYFMNIKCEDNGKLSFDKKPKLEAVDVENLDDETLDRNVPGTWEGFHFSTDEAVMVKPGKFVIRDPDGDREFTCPGLVFSCRLAKIKIDSCEKSGGNVSASFSLFNASPEYLEFQFKKPDKRVLKHRKESKSPELKELKVEPVDGKYVLSVPLAADVESLQLSIPSCVGQYYVYSSIPCGKAGGEMQRESVGNELKCGGYMAIEDRVKCRLSLREDQEDEYENFYPEECKATPNDWKKCLETYKAVQSCWRFPGGNARISCVQKQLKLGEIKGEKKKCQQMQPGEKGKCVSELNEKVHSLVKFRLYNLEEEAEELMEKGMLTLEQVSAFVVKMEQGKLKYNQAKNNRDRKVILAQAKDDWKSLMAAMET